MISAPQGTCVWWNSIAEEEGFATYNMHSSKSSSKKCFNNGELTSQPFYLIIPAGKKGLQPGLSYKFQINAETPDGGFGQSNFMVETMPDILVDGIFLEVLNLSY